MTATQGRPLAQRGLLIALGAVVFAGVGWTLLSTWADIRHVGEGVLQALWTLPIAILLHLVQLFLSGIAWRTLFIAPRQSLAVYFRLRLIREGIDSLFPVAQIGGEVIAARMLAKRGMEAAQAGASVIVDVSLEVLAQAAFLLIGVGLLAMLAGSGRSAAWLGTLAMTIIAAGGFLLAQRLGVLRLLEMLANSIARRFPDLTGSLATGPSAPSLGLTGLHAAAAGFYRRRRALLRATALHLLSWSLGTFETWIVLHAVGSPASLAQAFVVESLGMAARTAGFAIPGALAVQEGGFALAALSVGLPESAGLSLSLIKRVREVVVGIAGVTLAR